jgi:hypothetical protein
LSATPLQEAVWSDGELETPNEMDRGRPCQSVSILERTAQLFLPLTFEAQHQVGGIQLEALAPAKRSLVRPWSDEIRVEEVLAIEYRGAFLMHLSTDAQKGRIDSQLLGVRTLARILAEVRERDDVGRRQEAFGVNLVTKFSWQVEEADWLRRPLHAVDFLMATASRSHKQRKEVPIVNDVCKCVCPLC